MLLDLVIIVPYYASLSEAHDTSSGTLTFLRSFRLLRMVRLLRLLNLQRYCREFEEMLGGWVGGWVGGELGLDGSMETYDKLELEYGLKILKEN